MNKRIVQWAEVLLEQTRYGFKILRENDCDTPKPKRKIIINHKKNENTHHTIKRSS